MKKQNLKVIEFFFTRILQYGVWKRGQFNKENGVSEEIRMRRGYLLRENNVFCL